MSPTSRPAPPAGTLRSRQATAIALLDRWWNRQVLPFYAGITALSLGFAIGGVVVGVSVSLVTFVGALGLRRLGQRVPAVRSWRADLARAGWGRLISPRSLTASWLLCSALAVVVGWRRGDLLGLLLACLVLFPIYRRLGAPSEIEQKAAWAGLQLWAHGAKSEE